MLEKVTVVIPAHNRPERLQRLLNYLAPTEAKILIPDSSTLEYTGTIPRPENTTYIHRPGMHFLLKIREILPLISTEYVIYCADDDFIVPTGVQQCVDFLDQNPSFVVAQGHYLTFTPRKSHIEFSPRYIRNFYNRVVGNTAEERLLGEKSMYASLLYALVRTDCFKCTYTHCFDAGGNTRFKNLFLAEEYFHHSMLIQGNYATLPVFFSARERIENSATDTTTPIATLKAQEEFQHEYSGYLTSLTQLLSACGNLPIEQASKIINLATTQQRDTSTVSLKRMIVMFLSRHKSLRFLSRVADRRYRAKGLKAVAGMESYPCTFDTPERTAIIAAVTATR